MWNEWKHSSAQSEAEHYSDGDHGDGEQENEVRGGMSGSIVRVGLG